jgi:hypothetical protein
VELRGRLFCRLRPWQRSWDDEHRGPQYRPRQKVLDLGQWPERRRAKVGFYTTSAHAAAQVRLKAGDKTLLQETVAINPSKPYLKQVAVPAGIDEHDLVASISDQGGTTRKRWPISKLP